MVSRRCGSHPKAPCRWFWCRDRGRAAAPRGGGGEANPRWDKAGAASSEPGLRRGRLLVNGAENGALPRPLLAAKSGASPTKTLVKTLAPDPKPMSVDRATVHKIAHLARIAVTEEEAA